MKTFGIRYALPGALLLGLVGCTGDENGVSASSPQATAPPTIDELDVEVPSAQEAQSQANQSINEANADAEFEKLKKEIEGDT